MCPPTPDTTNFLSTQQRSLHWSWRGQEGVSADVLAMLVASPEEQITIFWRQEEHRNMWNVLYWKNDQLEHERSNVYVSHLSDTHNASNQQLPYVQSSDPDLQTHISAHLGTIRGIM